VNPTTVNRRLCQNKFRWVFKYCRKVDFVENVCPENLALFDYVSMQTAESVKIAWLQSIKSDGSVAYRNASDCGARVPGFDSRLWQGLLFVCFVFLLLCICLDLKPLFVTKCSHSFSFSILIILHSSWPIIRVLKMLGLYL